MTWNIVVFEFLSAFCFGLHDHIARMVGSRHGLKIRATRAIGFGCRCQGHPRDKTGIATVAPISPVVRAALDRALARDFIGESPVIK